MNINTLLQRIAKQQMTQVDNKLYHREEGTHSGSTFSCLTNKRTFATTATVLFSPSIRILIVALLCVDFT